MEISKTQTMDEEDLGELLYKVVIGKASMQEIAFLEGWKTAHPEEWAKLEQDTQWDAIHKALQANYSMNEKVLGARLIPFKSKWKRTVYPTFMQPNRRWMYAAAAVMIGLFFGIVGVRHGKEKKEDAVIARTSDVAPGGNRAVLTLGNGHQILLDSAPTGVISEQANTKIVKVDGGQIAYQSATNHTLEITSNNLETPPAGQFQITLPDGTQVWLNNASKLTYPTAFVGKERQVELSGEAFFHVAKDVQKPFHVKVRGVDVQVLGTSFNINSYTNEPVIATTLVDGGVAVRKGDQAITLTPGHQARVDEKGSVREVAVNVDPIIAWKNGFFSFDETVDFAAAMRQLARWYDVEVEYAGPIPEKTFYGTIDRHVSLSQMLKIFESKEYSLRIVGRKLRVVSESEKGK